MAKFSEYSISNTDTNDKHNKLVEHLNKEISGLFNLIYPVGCIYISISATDPSTLFGGTWEAFSSGRMLVGVYAADADFDAAEKFSGEKTHTLTTAELPDKVPVQQDSAGLYFNVGSDADVTHRASYCGGGAHNNMPPYITTYMWKRTL